MSGQGKIARLPFRLREQVNLRLLDGQPYSKIISWLHTEPEALAVLDDYFNEAPFNPQNLSEWKQGGFARWKQQRDQVHRTAALADRLAKIVEASGGQLSRGTAPIVAGQVLDFAERLQEVREKLDGEDLSEEQLAALADSLKDLASIVTSMQSAEIGWAAEERKQRDSARKEEEHKLNVARFQRQTVEQFIKWGKTPEAQKILDSGDSQHVKMEQLRQMFFGEEAAA